IKLVVDQVICKKMETSVFVSEINQLRLAYNYACHLVLETENIYGPALLVSFTALCMHACFGIYTNVATLMYKYEVVFPIGFDIAVMISVILIGILCVSA